MNAQPPPTGVAVETAELLSDEERDLIDLWRGLDAERRALLTRILREPWAVERLRLEVD